ncbi:MAG: ribokinase [Anaerolineales bacterium]|nr:ribokinase [Anaerolineales bacterium]
MSHIVIVGSLNMDLVVRVPHMPELGETVLGVGFQQIPGGKGANQAVGAARMGAKVTIIGRIGSDDFGRELTENLSREGIDISNVTVDENEPSGIAMITVDEQGQNSIVVASGANMALTPEEIRSAWQSINDIDVVVMPLEIPLGCIEEAVRLAVQDNVKVVLNPAPAQKLSDELLGNIDVLVPNENETTLLTGLSIESIAEAETAAKKLLDKGSKAVVLTLGSRGALLVRNEIPAEIIAPFEVEVVDTTAAGDAFVAALSVGISDQLSLEDAVYQANAAGALAVTRMGAQPCMPTQSEVQELLENQKGSK